MARKQPKLPAPLARLQRRFAAWRGRRNRGERIPEELWNAAAGQAVRYGVSQTSAALRLSYYSLQERVARQQKMNEPAPLKPAPLKPAPLKPAPLKPAFVELVPAAIPAVRECVIECEDARGTRMRVQLKGCETADVVAWGRAFFGARD